MLPTASAETSIPVRIMAVVGRPWARHPVGAGEQPAPHRMVTAQVHDHLPRGNVLTSNGQADRLPARSPRRPGAVRPGRTPDCAHRKDGQALWAFFGGPCPGVWDIRPIVWEQVVRWAIVCLVGQPVCDNARPDEVCSRVSVQGVVVQRHSVPVCNLVQEGTQEG